MLPRLRRTNPRLYKRFEQLLIRYGQLRAQDRDEWLSKMTKTELVNPTEDEQVSFYKLLLQLSWLSPNVRNAIIREFGDKLGFLSVRSYNALSNDLKMSAAKVVISDIAAKMKKFGHKGRRYEDVLEVMADSMSISSNSLKMRLHRHNRRTR
jgi:hypothetical protein